MMEIPRAKERLKFIEFISKFSTVMGFINQDLSRMKNCLHSLLESPYFRMVMVCLLAIVNFVNNSNLQGFGIESLNNVRKFFL